MAFLYKMYQQVFQHFNPLNELTLFLFNDVSRLSNMINQLSETG
jgi:hypothetical protein